MLHHRGDQGMQLYRRVRGALAVVAAAALTVAGCRDAVREDLQAYARAVLAGVDRAERESARELDVVFARFGEGRSSAAALSRAHRGTVAPLVDRLVREVLEPYKPATPELARVHAQVLAHYQRVRREVEAAAVALERGDWKGAEAAHARLAKLGFAPLRAELARLAKAHGLELTGPVREAAP